MTRRTSEIVLVEDNDIDFDIFKMIVQTLKVDVNINRFARVQNVVEAIEHKQLSARLSLAICDLRLPDGNGREVVEAFRASSGYAHTPIVILSTSANPRDITDCYAAGANAFHCKLTDLDELTVQIGKMLNYWLGSVIVDRSNA